MALVLVCTGVVMCHGLCEVDGGQERWMGGDGCCGEQWMVVVGRQPLFADICFGHGHMTTGISEVWRYPSNGHIVHLQEHAFVYSCDVSQTRVFDSSLWYYF